MRVFSFIIFIALGMLLTGSALVAILVYFDPFQAPGSVFGLFYLSLFLFLVGFFSLVIFGLKKVFLSEKNSWLLVPHSLRQALFLSVLGIILLYLQQKQLITWWSLAVLLAGLLALELIFRNVIARRRA